MPSWCGDSPLHRVFRYHDAVKLLIDRGADVNVRNKSNSTLLHETSGIGNLGVMQLLLSHGAGVNAVDCWGDSPLHRAFRHHEVLELLINGGADVNIRNKSSSTPLHEASGIGNLDAMRLLLRHGANVNVSDRWEDTPLHKAFRFHNAARVKLLVDGGAGVNVRNKFNSTPLHEASCIRRWKSRCHTIAARPRRRRKCA